MYYHLKFKINSATESANEKKSLLLAFDQIRKQTQNQAYVFLYDQVMDEYHGYLVIQRACTMDKDEVIEKFIGLFKRDITLKECLLSTQSDLLMTLRFSKNYFNDAFSSFLNSESKRIMEDTEKLLEDELVREGDFDLIEYAQPFENLINQIQVSNSPGFIGHCYHYVIIGKNRSEMSEVTRALTYHLYKTNRLLYPIINRLNLNEQQFRMRDIDLYSVVDHAYGSVLLIDLTNTDFEQINQRNIFLLRTELLEAFMALSPKVLLVFWTDDEKNPLFKDFINMFDDMRFLKVEPCLLDHENAMTLLEKMVKEDQLDFNDFKDLLSPSDPLLSVRDIERKFKQRFWWVLENQYYPLPNLDNVFNSKRTKVVSGQAMRELNGLIGLKEVKLQIDKLLNVSLWLKRFKDLNIPIEQFSKHMVFTGNPGTAKTTVARLVGQLFKEHGLLSRGHFNEVTRKDLIGEYVGQTAVKVHQLIQQSIGGVLFIDEAYSLYEDTKVSYVPEALGVIMAEMENHRDDLIIIFAGYPEEMEKFLDMNPGFRSRIGFYLKFEDYDKRQLNEMFQKIIIDKGFMLSGESIEMLDEFILYFQQKPNFGQGRTIRNLVEKVIIEHLYDLPEDGDGLSAVYMRTIQNKSLVKVQFSGNSEKMYQQIKYS
jgi:AAA+ superfamily predicted ATPase